MMRLRALAALSLCAWLLACGGGDKPWHATDITGAMPKLKFRMQRANDAQIVSEQNYRGRVVILYFGYTHCPDICPTTLANLSAVLKRLDTQAYDVAVLFVTVDPDRDTQPVLAQYVHGFARQVEGLSGPPNGLMELTRRYRVMYKVEKDAPGHPYAVMHSNSVFFFDRSGAARLVATDTSDTAGITEDVKRLLS
ncbi:MAG: SCO family protein [Alphaproteobacteria bacterium]|nr:SCO family protein [Alphaproteobacteria bacterium]MBV9693985.1 SCO family protein [Alphaproteobacteria bacterium]